MASAESAPAFDHSSDPAFVAYYTAQSAAPHTVANFTRLRDRALGLMAARGMAHRELQVLDIGCGAGTQARLWAELGHRVHALDVSAELIEVGRARAASLGLEIDFEVGTATRLPYPDGTIDVCLMPELLEHVQDWQTCLREAVRVLRPGAMLYLSTSSALCPKQQEFDLPLYSWFPAPVKRRFERLAVTTRPELVNHARYPAVNWFTVYGLSRFLGTLGVCCMDRFDVMVADGRPPMQRVLLAAVRMLPPLRFLGHVMTPGTMLFGFKQDR